MKFCIEVQLGLRSQSSDSQHSFLLFPPCLMAMKCFSHSMKFHRQKKRKTTSAGAAFLVCVGGVSLVGASSSVAPGLSQDPMSFTSTRTAGLPFKDLFVNILGFNRFAHFVCAILLSQKDSPGWNFSKL